MEFNRPARGPAFARIASWLGEDIEELDEDEASRRAVKAVRQLRADIGIPDRLRDLQVSEGQLPGFAEKALSIKRVCRVNPRPVTLDDLQGILQAAY